jgi:hypothetical protein
MGPRKEDLMKPIDDQTREAILELAEEIEGDGWVVNRRAMAREFGVSPQTIARMLDGPNARRGHTSDESGSSRGRSRLLGIAGVAGTIVLVVLVMRRGGGPSYQWPPRNQ